MRLEVSVDTAAATRLLSRLGQAAEDLRPFWLDTVQLLEDATANRFDRDGQGDWPALDVDTITRRADAGIVSREPLEASGRLRASLTATGHPDAVRRIDGDRLTFGTAVPYAGYVAARRDPLPDVDQRLAGRIADTLIAHLTGDL